MSTSNPYIGPRPFQSDEKALFFGREKDADKLLSMIIDNKIVILYAQSGAGKTSLINACLKDLLEQEEFEVLKVDRIGDKSGKDKSTDNIFIFNTLVNLNFKSNKIKEDRNLLYFVEKHYAGNPFVIIFDQFEEIFTTHRDKWQDREGFFKEIEKLCESYPMSRIVFALREDYLGYFDSYSNIWNDSPHYFRLELLKREGALAAVTNPVRSKNRKYAPGVAEMIVQELLQSKFQDQEGQTKIIEGEFIEPVHLQIVCRKLWDSLLPEENNITKAHLKKIGGVETVLEDFYESALTSALEKYPNKEKKLRYWINKNLITPIETRGSVLYGKTETGGIPNPIIDSLRDSYLIRIEKRAGARWISLSHDRFIEPILESNHRWELEQLKQQQKTQREEIQSIRKQGIFMGVALLIPLLIMAFFFVRLKLNKSPERAFKQLYKGKQYLIEKKYADAKNCFSNSFKNQRTVEASFYLARTHARLGEKDEAIQQFQQTIQLDSTYAETYYRLGLLFVENRNYQKGYRNLIKYFNISENKPRSVLSPELYADFVAYYFKSKINSPDSSWRYDALNIAIKLTRQSIPFTPMGRSPTQGFDNSGFITYVLQEVLVFDSHEIFSPKKISHFDMTHAPMPMDLIIYPGFNNTSLFYLGEFFGETLCIGSGLTAFVDIVDVSRINFPHSFYHVDYR